MEVEAKARYMRLAPRKARLVAASVVGLPVKDALTLLDFTPRDAAKEVAKVVKSAAANATNNFSQDEDALVVKRILVDEGPTLKRGRPRARGMYFGIFKRTCHITAVVDTEVQVAPRSVAAPTTAEAPTKPKAAPKRTAKAKAAEAAPVERPEEDEEAGTQASPAEVAEAEAEPAEVAEVEPAEVKAEVEPAEVKAESAKTKAEAAE